MSEFDEYAKSQVEYEKSLLQSNTMKRTIAALLMAAGGKIVVRPRHIEAIAGVTVSMTIEAGVDDGGKAKGESCQLWEVRGAVVDVAPHVATSAEEPERVAIDRADIIALLDSILEGDIPDALIMARHICLKYPGVISG